MITKKLLLLVLTMLLISTDRHLSATRDFSEIQEYSDTESTDSLLSETSRELMQAYDLLEMLKKRSEEFSYGATEIEKKLTTHLPRNIDQIRNRLIKKQLLDVLSATPFSNPEKHLADCKLAITALESYTEELKKASNGTEQVLTQVEAIDTASIGAHYDIAADTTTPAMPEQSMIENQQSVPAPVMQAPLALPLPKRLMPTSNLSSPIMTKTESKPLPLPASTTTPATQSSLAMPAPATMHAAMPAPMTPPAAATATTMPAPIMPAPISVPTLKPAPLPTPSATPPVTTTPIPMQSMPAPIAMPTPIPAIPTTPTPIVAPQNTPVIAPAPVTTTPAMPAPIEIPAQ